MMRQKAFRFQKIALLILSTALLSAPAFAAKEAPAHEGLRQAIDAHDYAKARSILKLGVKDVYCGEMPTDTAKTIWAQRWKKDPDLARKNCARQYYEAFPAADCNGPGATAELCRARLELMAETGDHKTFLVVANAALGNPAISKKLQRDGEVKESCGKNPKCKQQCLAGVEADYAAKADKLLKSEADDQIKGTALLKLATGRAAAVEECNADPFVARKQKVSIVADIVEDALVASTRSATGYTLEKEVYDRAKGWVAAARSLQTRHKLFGAKAGNVFPSTAKWAENQIVERATAAGRFTRPEVVLFCATDTVAVDAKFRKLTSVRCPVSCGNDLYAHGACPDVLTDSRDGKRYATVAVGEQVWMAENLNFGTLVGIDDPQGDASATSAQKWSPTGDEVGCATYGALYQWHTAMGLPAKADGEKAGEEDGKVRGICPEGWHLPTRGEWKELRAFVDKDNGGTIHDEGQSLKSMGEWYGTPGRGLDSYGWNAIPAGRRDLGGELANRGAYANWWSATDHDGDLGWFHALYGGYAGFREYAFSKKHGFSVRCVKDDPRTSVSTPKAAAADDEDDDDLLDEPAPAPKAEPAKPAPAKEEAKAAAPAKDAKTDKAAAPAKADKAATPAKPAAKAPAKKKPAKKSAKKG